MAFFDIICRPLEGDKAELEDPLSWFGAAVLQDAILGDKLEMMPVYLCLWSGLCGPRLEPNFLQNVRFLIAFYRLLYSRNYSCLIHQSGPLLQRLFVDSIEERLLDTN